ncbi:metallophosphoesterase, partial [Turicibacter sanguinis]|nr:metallophosphoesterase [Turicibacter sanguinis]
MKIGIISDTHGLLRDEVKSNLQDCDLILHAGDVGNLELINELNSIT